MHVSNKTHIKLSNAHCLWCSQREIQRGDEIAWYADGDTTVTSELNQAAAYAFGEYQNPFVSEVQ